MLFDQELYKLHDRVAIGTSLGPTLANVSFCKEIIWLQNCPSDLKPLNTT